MLMLDPLKKRYAQSAFIRANTESINAYLSMRDYILNGKSIYFYEI